VRDGLVAALDQRDEACLLVDGDARVSLWHLRD